MAAPAPSEPASRAYAVVRWVTIIAAGVFALLGGAFFVATRDYMALAGAFLLAGVTLLVGSSVVAQQRRRQKGHAVRVRVLIMAVLQRGTRT